ncbi:MAG: chromate efflux transporter [Thermoanaerobaculia bacterium]
MTLDPGPPAAVSFGEALRWWLRLGFISFGGPAGQIAIMHDELVVRRRWISERRFLHALNYCMALPGPEAQQLATYIGWLLHRTPGGILAGACFVVPSIFVLLGLSILYAAYGSLPTVAGVLSGLKPVVVAVVVEAVWRIGRRALRRRAHLAIAAAAFVAIYLLGVPFPWIVLGAGLLGLAASRFWPEAFRFEELGPRAADTVGSDRAVLSDDAGPAPHTLPSASRLGTVAAVGFLLWLVPLLALAAARGWRSLHVLEYRFFTQAALVTFGGAYAVLAYVTQAAVGTFHWLTHAQAVDGLALAETTPGPLIMVLQFVGFMAGWRHPDGMTQLGSGVLGALVTTYTTFLPSFLFILLGAPYVETLRGNRRLSAALAGITAAVVGVILNLAFVFGQTVLFPGGFPVGVNVFSVVLCAASLLALLLLRVDLLWVIAGGAAAGLLRASLLG